jgi:hypothetical protein
MKHPNWNEFYKVISVEDSVSYVPTVQVYFIRGIYLWLDPQVFILV